MVYLSALVSLACVLASLRRLLIVTEPAGLDPEILRCGLRDLAALGRLRAAVDARGASGCEAALLHAATEPDAAYRAARIEEEVLEVDWWTQRWARVPRVAASIATSAGFLCACVTMISALSDSETGFPLTPALNALAVGIAGTAFCAAVHVRLRAAVRERLTDTDRLVDRLRVLGAPEAGGGATPCA